MQNEKTSFLVAGIVIGLIATASVGFALNCGGGYFDYDSDYGTSKPYDDVRGYTKTYGYSHNGVYTNYLHAYTLTYNGSASIQNTDSGYNKASVNTGWQELPGYDEGYVYHEGKARCDHANCEGYNDLYITETVTKP